MEKGMYPEVPPMGGMPDAPPSYNQIQPMPPASAPMAPMPMPGQAMPAGPPMSMPVGQPQQQPFGQPQAIFVQPAVPLPPLGPRPVVVTCPSCHQQKMSKLRYETSTKTHLFAALLCVLGLFCCACIPYCVDNCKNPNHYCSICDAYLGTYK